MDLLITEIRVRTKQALDSEASSIAEYARNILKVQGVDYVVKSDLYVFDRTLPSDSAELIRKILADNDVAQTYEILNLAEDPMTQPVFDKGYVGNWGIRTAYKTDPLMRDDFGLNAKQAVADMEKALRSVDVETRKRLFGVTEIPDLTVGEVRRIQEFLLFGNLSFDDVQKINQRRLSDVKVHDSIYFIVSDSNET